MALQLRVKRLSEHAVLPFRATTGAAGHDLASAVSIRVPAHGKQIIPTDLAIALPEGVYGRIAPRSGLAWKSHIDVGAGVVDRDFRGNVGVILFNHSSTDLHIKQGDRVAQLILERYAVADVVEVDELDVTTRGAGGFGSTGVESSSAGTETKSKDGKEEEHKGHSSSSSTDEEARTKKKTKTNEVDPS